MEIRKIIIVFVLLLSLGSFAQSKEIKDKVNEINSVLKKETIHKGKNYEELEIYEKELVLVRVGQSNSKRRIPIDKSLIKKVKINYVKRFNKDYEKFYSATLEIKATGKHIYNEALKGKYSNSHMVFSIREKKTGDKIKNMLLELIAMF